MARARTSVVANESAASIRSRLQVAQASVKTAQASVKTAQASVKQLEVALAAAVKAEGDPQAFLRACFFNNRSELQRLLRRYPGTLPSAWLTGEYQAKNGGLTALQLAGYDDNMQLARRLLESGAKVDKVTTFSSSTPLLIACKYNHLEVATLLLDYGANASVVNTDGDTPLSIACSRGHEKVATLLILRGAKYGKKN